VGKLAGAVFAVLLLATAGLGGCVAAVTGADPAAGGAAAGGGGNGGTATAAATTPAVPAAWETLDRSAAATCPGLAWSVLGAIGRIESDSGRSTLPGVASGANPAGAEGPMQFEPATFAAYATVGPGGAQPPSPYDPVDAVYTAARLLCADGGGDPGHLSAAVADYNHSAVYVDTVLLLALSLGAAPALTSGAAAALAFAAGQLGAPYRWGGTGPGGWDCSGLTQAAYRAGGVALPRVAQDQFDAGPAVPADTGVQPGDLVFFGASVGAVTHVGLYVGDGEMVDAPHTGAVVRVEPAGWADFVGATRPG
jgi:cell wall-associated NlpC family hydrolase